jgi:hypothetical protein
MFVCVAAAPESPKHQKIFVTSVKVMPTRIQGYAWRVIATGAAPSAGWTDARLEPTGVNESAGFITLKLIAVPGGGATVMMPMTTEKLLKAFPNQKGVRVYGLPMGPGATPFVEALFPENEPKGDK